MKGRRTLSIYHPAIVNARNERSAWGASYWKRTNLRKRAEFALRQSKRASERFLLQLQPFLVTQLDDVPAASQKTPPGPVVH